MASVHAWRRRVFNLPKVAPPEPGGWQGNKVGFALLTCETLEFVVFMSDSSALARRYSLAEGFRLLIGPGIFASRHWTVDRLGDEGIQVQVRDLSRPGAPNDGVCPAEDDQPDRGRRAVFPALLSRTIIVVKTEGRSSLSVNTRTNSHQARINPEPIPSHSDTTPRNGNGKYLLSCLSPPMRPYRSSFRSPDHDGRQTRPRYSFLSLDLNLPFSSIVSQCVRLDPGRTLHMHRDHGAPPAPASTSTILARCGAVGGRAARMLFLPCPSPEEREWECFSLPACAGSQRKTPDSTHGHRISTPSDSKPKPTKQFQTSSYSINLVNAMYHPRLHLPPFSPYLALNVSSNKLST